MGLPPSDRHTLERKDNNGNYEPGNVRWATMREQGCNKRSNRLLTYRGETMPVIQWCRRMAIPKNAVLTRLRRGWSVERALETPIQFRSEPAPLPV
jgi:hypothetical protein